MIKKKKTPKSWKIDTKTRNFCLNITRKDFAIKDGQVEDHDIE